MKRVLRRWAAAAITAATLAGLTGCAVLTVGGAAIGAAISVTGAVVSAGVELTGKAIGVGIDAVSDDDETDDSGIVIRYRERPAGDAMPPPASAPLAACGAAPVHPGSARPSPVR